MTRVVIADDDANVRMLVAHLLVGELDFELVGEAHDGPTAIQAVETLLPDLLILDLVMPGASGSEVLIHVKQTAPNTKIFVLTAYPDMVDEALELADGRLAKTEIEELVHHLRDLTP